MGTAAMPHFGEGNGDLSKLLASKVAIITGASRGIGAAAAQTFAAAGAAVVLAARDERALRAVADNIASHGGRALAVPTDVGDPQAVQRLVERAVEAYGRLCWPREAGQS